MNPIRCISAFALAIMVLASTTSFMVGMHLCQGELQNIALFTKAAGCEKEKSLPPCHRHATAPCCEDDTIVHDGADFKAPLAETGIIAPLSSDLPQPLVLIFEIIPAGLSSRIKYSLYEPPWRSCDFTVDHQVFLI